MSQPQDAQVETDPRFPSGPWTGFFLMPHTGSQRHPTQLTISFAGGTLTGGGRDAVGAFIVRGRYDTADGKCRWVKHYVGKHDVFYHGFNEGKGIWGLWDIPNSLGIAWKGGFHIWPEGMEDPTQPTLYAEADPPVVEETHVREPVVVS
ncbi:MAG: hypothetical protein ACJ8F7_13110 [Gemmataceae bacterium]